MTRVVDGDRVMEIGGVGELSEEQGELGAKVPRPREIAIEPPVQKGIRAGHSFAELNLDINNNNPSDNGRPTE